MANSKDRMRDSDRAMNDTREFQIGFGDKTNLRSGYSEHIFDGTYLDRTRRTSRNVRYVVTKPFRDRIRQNEAGP